MHPLYPKADAVFTDALDACVEVLDTMGMGLLESVYAVCLERELILRGHTVAKEKNVAYTYKGHTFSTNLRADLLVDDCLAIELKSIEGELSRVHQMQLLSYMKLLDYPLGLLANFGATERRRFKRLLLKGANRA